MADTSYLDRKIDRNGVAPVKDPQTQYDEALRQSINQRARVQYNPVVGRIDRRTDRNIGDVSYLTPEDINDRRYRAQSSINRLARGLGNMGAIAGTTFLDATIGNIAELISVATGNGTFNPVTRGLNKWQENVLARHQIYRPRGYENLSVLQQLGSSVFWGDLIQNAGFTVGMMAAGALGGALGLSGAAAMVAPAIASALAEARTEGLGVKNDVIDERLSPLTAEYNRRRAFITDQESLNALDRWYADKYTEIIADSNKAGNTALVLNATLLMATNMLGWGSTLRRGSTFTKQTVNKALAERGVKLVDSNGKKLTADALRQNPALLEGMGLTVRRPAASTAINLGKRVGEAVSEAGEEIFQGVISDFSKRQPSVYDYTLLEEDLAERENIDTMWEAAGSAFKEMWGAKETWIEGLTGAFTSILGVPSAKRRQTSSGRKYIGPSWGGGLMEFAQEYRENQSLRNTINTIDKNLKEGKYSTLIDNLVRTKAFADRRIEAAVAGDDFNFKNYDLGELLSTIQTFDSIGRLDVLDAILEKSSSITDEEAKELRDTLITPEGIATLTDQSDEGVANEVRRILGENADKVKTLKKNYLADKAALESSGHDFSIETTGQYLFGKALLNDLAERKGVITGELNDFLGRISADVGESNWDSEGYRSRARRIIEDNPYITPDEKESYLQKIEDLGRIDKAASTTAASLQKIWDNPAVSNYEAARQKAEAIESNFRESERKRLAPLTENLLSNNSSYINTAVNMLLDRQASDLSFVSEMLSEDETGQGAVKADEIKKTSSVLAKFVQSMRKAGYEDFEAYNHIKSVLSSAGFDSAASLNDALYKELEKKLPEEKVKEIKAEKERLDKVDTMVKSKSSKEGLFSKGATKAEDSGEETGKSGDSHESDDDDPYDDMTRSELLKLAEEREQPERRKADGTLIAEGFTFEDIAPDYHNYSDDDLREALRQDNAGQISKQRPYRPKARPAAAPAEVSGIVSSSDAEETSDDKAPVESPVVRKKAEERPSPDNLTTAGADKAAAALYAENEPKGRKVRDKETGRKREVGEYYGDEDAFQVGRRGTLYNVEELASRHTAVDNSQNSFVGRLMRLLGEEEWLLSGGFTKWAQWRQSQGKPLTINLAKVIVRDSDTGEPAMNSKNTILAVVETEEKGPLCIVDNIGNEHYVHVLGAIGATSKTKSTWKSFFDAVENMGYPSKTLEEAASGQPSGLWLPYYTELSFAYSGRMVKADENYPNPSSDKNLLDIMPRDKDGNVDSSMVQFAMQTRSGETFTIGEDLEGSLIPLNSNNRNPRAGTVWMRVREVNGQITHKYVSPKTFNSEEYPLEAHRGTPIMRRINAVVSDLVEAGRAGDLNAVKDALHRLRRYLIIPDNKKLIVDTRTKEALITGDTEGQVDLTSADAQSKLLNLIYSVEYSFNVSFYKDEWTKEDLIASDILKTDLARVQNVNNSYIVKQIEIHEDGSWSLVDSEAGNVIRGFGHSGYRRYQKDRSSLKFTINGNTYYITSDSSTYLDSDREPVTDPLQTVLIELYSDIVNHRALSRFWFKRQNNPIYEIINPVSNMTEFYLLDGKNLRKMTEAEFKEWEADYHGRGKKKDETVKYRIGNSFIAAAKFGRVHHLDTPDSSLYRNDKGIPAIQKEYHKDSPLKGFRADDGNLLVVPDYSIRGVLTRIFNGTETFPELFDYTGTPEKGYIPVVRKEAAVSEKGIVEKGLIEWVQVDLNTGKRVRSDSTPSAGKTETGPIKKGPVMPAPKGKRNLFEELRNTAEPEKKSEEAAKKPEETSKVPAVKVTNQKTLKGMPVRGSKGASPVESTSDNSFNEFAAQAMATYLGSQELGYNLRWARDNWDSIKDFVETHSFEDTWRYVTEASNCMPF